MNNQARHPEEWEDFEQAVRDLVHEAEALPGAEDLDPMPDEALDILNGALHRIGLRVERT